MWLCSIDQRPDIVNNFFKKLEKLEVTLIAQKQKQQMIIHYDNAPSHNANSVNNYIMDSLFTRMPHPAYCPELAPCDFGVQNCKREL